MTSHIPYSEKWNSGSGLVSVLPALGGLVNPGPSSQVQCSLGAAVLLPLILRIYIPWVDRSRFSDYYCYVLA